MKKVLTEKDKEQLKIAERVRRACLQAARDGFREASLSGLCLEGAVEAAVGSIQSIKLEEIVFRDS